MARRRKRKEREAEAGFAEAPVPDSDDGRQRLTPVEIQEKVFRLAFRGYSERDVDEFLDRITEDLAALHEENKRLREQLAEGGVTGGFEEAQGQAEAIVRQAREHAARLIEDAEGRAAGDDMAPSTGLPTSFLLEERQFLQQMAGLIQGHARRLKEDARRARATSPEAPREEETAEPSAASVPPEEPPASAPGAGEVPTAATSDEEPTPEPEPERPVVLPEAQEERTAPWTQVDPPEGSEEGTGPDPDEDQDPLLSAWESAFTAEGGAEAPREEAALYPSEVRNRKEDEGEPSLRELFWGDEG